MTVNLVDLPPPNPKPLNGRQFSQGTLWNPRAMKPSPEHRWAAHGYSPERREAVREVIPEKNVSVTSKYWKGDIFPAQNEVGGKVKNQRTATRNALVDVVARSTMPIEDLARNTPKFKVGVFSIAGQMRTKYDTVAQRPVQGEVRLNPYHTSRESAEHTVLHELGHHTDFEADPTKFSRTAHTEMIGRSSSPSLEGAAEGYAARHRVARRNEPPADYARTAASGYRYMHGISRFQEHFQRVSGRTVDEAMGKSKPTHLGEQFEQPSLFEPLEVSSDEWEHLTGKKAS